MAEFQKLVVFAVWADITRKALIGYVFGTNKIYQKSKKQQKNCDRPPQLTPSSRKNWNWSNYGKINNCPL